MEATVGPIGFAVQRSLLEVVAPWLPEGVQACLMADRFYGTPDLISLCQGLGWDDRLRLRGNLVARDGGRTTKTGALARSRTFALEDVQLTARRATTSIGIMRDPGHAEAWIVEPRGSPDIAMPGKPGYLATLGHSKRWGIEPMLSDFKSRGFGVEDTQIQHPGRLARLLLVMALALHCALLTYCAVSAGHWDAEHHAVPAEKPLSHQPKKVARSRTSWLTRRLRRITKLIQAALPLPPLWAT